MTYPRGEIVWTGYHNRAGDLMFIMTSKESRDYYYLYEVSDGEFKKLGKAKSPPELEEKYRVHERMREQADSSVD